MIAEYFLFNGVLFSINGENVRFPIIFNVIHPAFTTTFGLNLILLWLNVYSWSNARLVVFFMCAHAHCWYLKFATSTASSLFSSRHDHDNTSLYFLYRFILLVSVSWILNRSRQENLYRELCLLKIQFFFLFTSFYYILPSGPIYFSTNEVMHLAALSQERVKSPFAWCSPPNYRYRSLTVFHLVTCLSVHFIYLRPSRSHHFKYSPWVYVVRSTQGQFTDFPFLVKRLSLRHGWLSLLRFLRCVSYQTSCIELSRFIFQGRSNILNVVSRLPSLLFERKSKPKCSELL